MPRIDSTDGMKVWTVGIVGAGVMGSGMSQVCASYGYEAPERAGRTVLV